MAVYFCRESTHHACRTAWGNSYGPQINAIELQREETMARPTFVWTLTQTEMNQTHSDLPHSKYQYRPTELQQSMSGIINHNVHTDVSSNSKQHEPSGCINLQGLGNAPCCKISLHATVQTVVHANEKNNQCSLQLKWMSGWISARMLKLCHLMTLKSTVRCFFYCFENHCVHCSALANAFHVDMTWINLSYTAKAWMFLHRVYQMSSNDFLTTTVSTMLWWNTEWTGWEVMISCG